MGHPGQIAIMKNLVSRRWLLLSILVLVGVIVMGSLGVWQVRRLSERRALHADIPARPAQPRPFTTLAASAQRPRLELGGARYL